MLPSYQDWWNGSTKIFGIRDELLKRIDHTLQAYHAAAEGTAQRKIFLGDIFVYSLCWCRENPQSSRLPAVFHLHGVASQEVYETFGAFSSNALDCLSKGEALPGTLTVRVRLLQTANVHRPIQADLDRASGIWGQAGLVVIVDPANAPVEQVNLTLLDGVTLGYVGEGELVQRVNLDRGFIHCCYAPRISGDGAAGKTERPADHVGHLFDPLIKIGADLARHETFAHELGHALLNDGSHHFDPRNVMAEGASRTGTELTPGQIALARGSRYAGY